MAREPLVRVEGGAARAVRIGGNVLEEGPRIVLPLGILEVVLPRPEDGRTISTFCLIERSHSSESLSSDQEVVWQPGYRTTTRVISTEWWETFPSWNVIQADTHDRCHRGSLRRSITGSKNGRIPEHATPRDRFDIPPGYGPKSMTHSTTLR